VNSSTFFANIFSTSCRESETGIVELRDSLIEPLSSVLKWIYNGQIEVAFENFMTVYHYSRYLGIKQLEGELGAELAALVNPRNVLKLCNQCYERSHTAALNELVPFIRGFLEEIPMAKLTKRLDVRVFASVIEGSELTNERRVELISAFIGDYQVTREEEGALRACLARDGTLKAAIVGKEISWLNPTWLKGLR
jgi:hypothetical protein